MKRYFFILVVGLFIVTIAMSQEYWYWQNPIPQGNELNDIWIFNAQIMLAVGDVGTVIKTTDGGANWTVKHCSGNSTSDLKTVFFIDQTTGWTAGSEGKILKTTDGGNNWSVKTILNISSINGLFFHDGQNGWAVGNKDDQGDQKGAILKTIDGGATWSIIENTNAGSLNHIYFFNEKVGWAIGSKYVVEPQNPEDIVLRTEDGGVTWVPQYSQKTTELYYACFVDSLHGWAVGKRASAGSVIIYTEDSGISWGEQSHPSPTKVLWAIVFRDQNLGWAAGEGGTMMKTVDGGNTWYEVTSQVSRNLKAIGFTDSKIVTAVGNAGIIVKSEDDGSYWQEMSSAFTRGNYHGVCFISSDTGWVVGPDKTILKSIDGGSTWTTESSSGTTERLWDIFFVNSQVGWTVGEPVYINDDGFILHTTDGGQNWIEQKSVSRNFLYSCFFHNEQIGWVCGGPFSGDSSVILYTFDGGKNWTPQNCLANASLRDIYFVDGLNGWAVGDNNNIVHTTDGGLKWSPVSIGKSEDFYSVFFITPEIGWIGGMSISQTTDGGATWTEQLTFSSENQVRDIYFIDSSIGWAAILGSSGGLYKTMDGGSHWSRLNIGTKNSLYNISIINNEIGWVVGTSSTIMKTDGIVVPVELVSFNAERIDNHVELSWSTATESNNYGFEVQRKSFNQTTWKKIGFVEGHRTTTQMHSYSFTDDNPQAGGTYNYRLKQIDLDGTFKYSSIREVTVPSKFALYQNHPNPFNPETTISFELPLNTHVTLDIYNMLGQKIVTLIDEHRPAGFQKILWNGRDKAGRTVGSGVYFYHIKSDRFEATKKLVLLR